MKKPISWNLLAVGFVVGMVAMYVYLQPKLAYQGKSANEWANLNGTLLQTNDELTKQDASKSASLKRAADYLKPYYAADDGSQLILKYNDIPPVAPPSPSPQVVYKTQYQTQYEPAPAQSYQAPAYKAPVTYTPNGNSGFSYGSDGSTCYNYPGQTSCSGGR